jgi:hypothetical protein
MFAGPSDRSETRLHPLIALDSTRVRLLRPEGTQAQGRRVASTRRTIVQFGWAPG